MRIPRLHLDTTLTPGAELVLAEDRAHYLTRVLRSSLEMHLESVGRQQVRIAAADLELTLADGERIHTESSVKYDAAMVERLMTVAGFARVSTATDRAGRFAVHVARAA